MRNYRMMGEARGALAVGDASHHDAPPPPDAGRTIDRRRALPGGRAVMGGFLIAVAIVGVFSAHQRATATPTVGYVIAARDIAPGTAIVDADLTVRHLSLPDDIASAAFTSRADLRGATSLGPLSAGELVQAGAVVRRGRPADVAEVSFAVEAARAVNGNLRPGEIVDVVSTYGTAGDTYTIVVVSGAKVVAVDRHGTSLGDSTTLTITLAVPNRDDLLALTHAVDAGKVTIIRGGGATGAAEYRPPR